VLLIFGFSSEILVAQNNLGLTSGNAKGCVLDAVTGNPISGAKITIFEPGTDVAGTYPSSLTSEDGCYSIQVPVGIETSKIDHDKLMNSSIASLIIGGKKSISKKTVMIYASSVAMSVEKENYKTFTGVNFTIDKIPQAFAVFLNTVNLSPVSADVNSYVTEIKPSDFKITYDSFPEYFEKGKSYHIAARLLKPVGFSFPFPIILNISKYPDLEVNIPSTKSENRSIYFETDNIKVNKYKYGGSAFYYSAQRDTSQEKNPGNLLSYGSGIQNALFVSSNDEIVLAKLYNNALKKFEEKDVASAEEILRDADQKDANNLFPDIDNLLLNIMAGKENNYENAIEYYNKTKGNGILIILNKLRDDKKYDLMYDFLNNDKKLMKDYLFTMAFYQPLDAANRIRNGRSKRGDYDTVFKKEISYFTNKSLNIDMTYENVLYRDKAYLLELSDIAIKNYPDDAKLIFNHGLLLYGNERKDEAFSYFDKISDKDMNEDMVVTIAKLYFLENKCQKVAEYSEKYNSKYSSTTNLFYINHLKALCSLENDNADEAKRNFEEALKYAFSEENKTVEGGDIVGGELIGNQIMTTNKSSTYTFYQKQTKILYSGFSFNEANYDYNYILAAINASCEKCDVINKMRRGITLYYLGYPNSAKKELQSILEKDPENMQAMKYVVLCDMMTGDNELFNAGLIKYLKLNPSDSQMATMAIDYYLNKKNAEMANSILSEMKNINGIDLSGCDTAISQDK